MIYMTLAGTVAVVLVSALLLQLTYTWLLPRPLPGIPHNPITSIWGDIPAIARNRKNGLFSDYVSNMAKTHGPISQLLMAWRSLVVVSDRAEAERILHGGNISDRTKKFRLVIATALPKSQLALPANETWKMHRRLAGPSMSKRYLENMSSRIAFGAHELIRLWKAKHALVGSSAFEVASDFYLATMDSIISIALGDSIGCIESAHNALPVTYSEPASIVQFPHSEPPPLYTAREVMLNGFLRALQTPFPRITTWLFVYTSPTWRKYYNLMNSSFTDALTRARERQAGLAKTGKGLSTNADCVLDMIVQREAQEGVEVVEDRDIIDELITYIFGGHDTTSATLSWLVKYLSTDPEIQRRLHEEMCTVFGDTESSEPFDFHLLDDPERVPILEAVVAETLRCAGIVPFVGRELLQDEVILGRFVPKGTPLFLTTDMMGKTESDWGPDAETWRPSRWLTPDGAFNRLAGPSIPFALGPRSCFGQRLAMLQLKTYLAAMSRAFFFKPVSPEVDTWKAVETFIKRPNSSYVSLESWDSKKV